MGLGSVLKSFNVDLEVVRPPVIVREKGRVVDAGVPDRWKIRAGVQPATPKDIQRLPEGQRTSATIAVYTCPNSGLRTADPSGTRADRVIPCQGFYAGVEFEIQSADPWPSYTRYLAIKAGQ